MIELTKNNRYSERAITALLENYDELKETITDANPSHMDPLYDFERAVNRVILTDLQRKVMETKYLRFGGVLSNTQTSLIVDASLSSVDKAIREIKDALLSEMNRGIADA